MAQIEDIPRPVPHSRQHPAHLSGKGLFRGEKNDRIEISLNGLLRRNPGNRLVQGKSPVDGENVGLTPFLSMGRAFSAPCQNGLGMLLMQGALAFRLWSGREPSVEVMEEALREATGQGDLWKSL